MEHTRTIRPDKRSAPARQDMSTVHGIEAVAGAPLVACMWLSCACCIVLDSGTRLDTRRAVPVHTDPGYS